MSILLIASPGVQCVSLSSLFPIAGSGICRLDHISRFTFGGLEHFLDGGAFYQGACHVWLSLTTWYVMTAAAETEYQDPLLQGGVPILNFCLCLLARIFI